MSMYTEVGFCALKRRCPDDFSVLSRFGGLVYVRNSGQLCLESTVGSRLCCLCCKESVSLSDVSQVEVVGGSITFTTQTNYKAYHKTHQMNPGLRIVLRNGDRIWMKMPDAVDFCTELRQQCNLPTITPSVVPMDDMLWNDIMGKHLVSTSSDSEETDDDGQAFIS